MRTEQPNLERLIRDVVDQLPPLSEPQRARLAALLGLSCAESIPGDHGEGISRRSGA